MDKNENAIICRIYKPKLVTNQVKVSTVMLDMPRRNVNVIFSSDDAALLHVGHLKSMELLA